MGILFSMFLCANGAQSETDLYSFPKIGDVLIEKKQDVKSSNPYIQKLSDLTQVSVPVIEEATKNGFYPYELVRLILISKKATQPLENLLAMREKGKWLSSIAKMYGLDNKVLKKESDKMIGEIETYMEEKKKPKTAPKNQTAGLKEWVSESTTHYLTAQPDFKEKTK